VRHAGIVARFALRESLRRRVFLVVALLTVAFLALYGLGVWQAFRSIHAQGEGAQPDLAGVDTDTVAAATLLGLAMFATMFLGTILAVFLTLGAIRGDAERGLLQPLLVRPLSRRDLLAGRFGAAAAVCAAYVVVVFLGAATITWAFGDWWPDRTVLPALRLAAAVAVLCALSLAGSVVLSSTANGIAVFMVFGAGLTGGLLGQIAEVIGSGTLDDVATGTSWALPFEALYQGALSDITANTVGFTRLALDLGPFGGAQSFGAWLWPYALAYIAVVGLLALRAFRHRDL
jgi:ABC-type transport system involved in multi-copper enzyme maturation permease subunit